MVGKLILSDETELAGTSFGYEHSRAGEVVFTTGMTGYPQAFTDPSFAGQILVMTYPLIGNYGVPDKNLWESDTLQVAGLIVSDYIDTPSHSESIMRIGEWLKKEKVPGLVIKDTRFLAQHLRDNGVMPGKIVINNEKIADYDPNSINIVAEVSSKVVTASIPSTNKNKKNKQKTVVLIDCGAKRNIERCFLNRGVEVITVPWDYNVFGNSSKLNFDALFLSNGPGDPKMCDKTIETVKKSLENKIPTLGICLGNQIMALAAGGDTYKLKFGHRSQNQPCLLSDSPRCFITTQNHGYAVGKIPDGFKPWFVNANDNSNEGIIHERLPFMSVQFHPEATPGPMDTEWIFDFFIERI